MNSRMNLRMLCCFADNPFICPTPSSVVEGRMIIIRQPFVSNACSTAQMLCHVERRCQGRRYSQMKEQRFRLRRTRLESVALGLPRWAKVVVFVVLPAAIGAGASMWVDAGIAPARMAILFALLFAGIGIFQLWLLHRGDWVRFERDGTVHVPEGEYGWGFALSEVTRVAVLPDGQVEVSWTRRFRGPTSRRLSLEDPAGFADAVLKQAPQLFAA